MSICDELEESTATSWNELLLDEGHLITKYNKCKEANRIKREALLEFMGKK